MISQQSSFKPTTYFTIFVPQFGPGFTDQLGEWSIFYKLGISLEYKYVHTSLICHYTPNIYKFLGFNEFFDLNMHEFLKVDNALAPIANDFIHYRRPFSSNKYQFDIKKNIKENIKVFLRKIRSFYLVKLWQRQYKFIDISINDEFLKKNNIVSLADLKKFIQVEVAEKSLNLSKNKQIIVRFSFMTEKRDKKNLFSLINSQIPEFPNKLNLRSSYFKYRRNQPQKSSFIEGKIKLLIHIRKGETAIIKTPWQTFIPVMGSHSLTEINNINEAELPGEQFDVNEVYNFAKNFISYFDENLFSIVVSSDGYTEAFSMIYNNIDGFNFTTEQIKKLRQTEILYNEKFKIFNEFKNCICLVGENDDNLFDFIHTIFEADIIISTYYGTSNLARKLINTYYDLNKVPIFIQLFKTKEPDKHNTFGDDSHKIKHIPVKLGEVNWEYLVNISKNSVASLRDDL